MNALWSPRVPRGDGPIYQLIADALEKDVEAGLLSEGSRLPTHRDLASKLGVTPLTITRAYKEAARRGLIDATVGRGTFVRAASSTANTLRQDGEMLDLSRNIIEGSEGLDLEPRLLADLRPLVRDSSYHPAEGMLRHRQAAVSWLARAGISTEADRVVIAPGAQQSIVAILAALCQPGDTVLAEEVSYPRVAAIASLLHLNVEPLKLDGMGVVPQSLEKACRRGSPRAAYIIPNLQNPTGVVMPEKRRHEIAAIARRHDLVIIEDDVYGFLLEKAPPAISTMLPELCCYVTSTSKSVTPSLRLGFTSLPESLIERVTSSLGAITAFTSSVAAEVFRHLLESGAADRAVIAKRKLVRSNRRAADRLLEDLNISGDPASPHLWLRLPDSCRPFELTERARLRGITLSPGSAFAVVAGDSPNAIRLSIGSIREVRQLESALRAVTALVASPRFVSTAVV